MCAYVVRGGATGGYGDGAERGVTRGAFCGVAERPEAGRRRCVDAGVPRRGVRDLSGWGAELRSEAVRV